MNDLAKLESAGTWEIDREAYHADTTRISSTSLKDFVQSPLLYQGRWITGEIEKSPDTPSRILGRAVHALTLTPDQFEDAFAVAGPGLDRRTNAGKAAHAALSAGGRAVLKAEEYARVQGMRDGLLAEPRARELLEALGTPEQPIRWTCPETGLPLKACLDRVLPVGIVLDIKTTGAELLEPEAWVREVARKRWHLQAAHYLEGARLAWGATDPVFVWLAVGDEPPFECVVHELDDLDRASAHEKLMDYRRELAACYATGVWRGRHHGTICRTPLPRYTF